MIDNKLISSKAVLAKIIADLDLKEDEIRITDVREWIGGENWSSTAVRT